MGFTKAFDTKKNVVKNSAPVPFAPWIFFTSLKKDAPVTGSAGYNFEHLRAAADHDPVAASCPAVSKVLQSSGNSFDTNTGTFFESRFGHDFRHVRVHADGPAADAAKQLNAEAFTIGHHIVFGQSRYQPGEDAGKRLLAHELTHVIQGSKGPETPSSLLKLESPAGAAEREAERMSEHITRFAPPFATPYISPAPSPLGIQRKIATHNAPVDDYLTGKGITQYDKKASVYSHAGVCTFDPDKEIIYGLLSSDIEFPIAGNTAGAAKNNLDRHVKARKSIVEHTYKKIKWGVDSTMKMNPRYWRQQGGMVSPQAGVSFVEASRDVFANPSGFDYAMACQAAAQVTFAAGSGSASYREATIQPDEWIPGDFGYIKNEAHRRRVSASGTEGENIIHVRGKMFWGHPFGEKTLDEWMGKIRTWNGNTGRPVLENKKKVTSVGLDE